MIKKHARKSQEHPEGAIIEREGPIHIPTCGAFRRGMPEPKLTFHQSFVH